MVAGSENKIRGSLKPLSPLPNPEHQRLFNAENCCLSTDGRVFVTGSTAVYEVLSAEEAGPDGHRYISCEYRAISIPKEVPEDCFRNGITASGHYLYLACAHVPQWEQSVLTEGTPWNAISQTKLSNLLWFLMTQISAHVDSYIVRADLRNTPIQFDEWFKMPEKCFANGLAADEGNLYVTNSVPGSSCIYKIDHKIDGSTGQGQHSPECMWLAPLMRLVNGLKCKPDGVYYTWNQFPVTGVGMINDKPNESIYETIGFYDDLYVLDNGHIILANASDLTDLSAILHFSQLPPPGSLIFLSGHQEVFDVVKYDTIFHPSAVMVVDRDSKVFAKGDIIVTDKGMHGEYAAFVFTPDDTCRSWFA